MNRGRTVFSQIIQISSHNEFRRCVERYAGNKYLRHFSCWDQFLAMAFAQLTYRESLRDIEVCLGVQKSKLYHCGFSGPVKRSTLADANEKRDWRIFADFAGSLIHIARPLYAGSEAELDLDAAAYALDSSTIDLCLSLFPWARFRRSKGAIKLHTLIDLQGSIPTFLHITDGKVHDVNVLDILVPEAGSFTVLDRGYVDFQRLYRFQKWLCFFVTRAKDNIRFRRRYSHSIDKSTGVRSDQTIVLTGLKTRKLYPDPLRRVSFYSEENDKRLVFLTNNFNLPSPTIATLYRYRWRVELFFKWIKQHLRIKCFFGTSENAVKTQVWISVAVYLLIAILKKQLGLPHSLYTILQFLSLSLFDKRPISCVFSDTQETKVADGPANQLILL